MTNWKINQNNDVVCAFCGAVIMTARENVEAAPPTAGTFTSGNAADNWNPDCPDNCPGSTRFQWEMMK